MAVLDVYLNGYLVGHFTKQSNGAHAFAYSEKWLAIKGARPISLSMPLSKQVYKGDVVYTQSTSRYLIQSHPELSVQGMQTKEWHSLSSLHNDEV